VVSVDDSATKSNATLGTPNPATLTIIDDDTIPSSDELYTYDLIGNLTSKTGVGAYSYSAAHPHAVTVVYSTTNGSAHAGSDYTGACLRRVDNPDPCLPRMAAQRHARPVIGLGSHQIGVRRGAATRRGGGSWPPTARRAGDQLPNR